MLPILRLGAEGDAVRELQGLLADAGFRSGTIDGQLGPATEAAILGFQRSRGLLADGIVGPLTWAELGCDGELPASVLDRVDTRLVARLFPFTRLDSISRNLPPLLDALKAAGLEAKPLVLMALATIRAESEGFEPVSEMPSRFNTSPGGHLFDLYDHRRDLGNLGAPDGSRFHGRGFVQLTGRANYGAVGRFIGLGDQLVREPDRASEPTIAARVLAAFLDMRRTSIKEALVEGDLARARRLVNGGRHGLERFVDCYRRGDATIDDPVWQLAA